MAAKGYRMDKQEKLLQLIDCPICLCELQDPRLLSCSHVMCYKCLVEYHDKGSYGSNLPCPECRQVTPLYKGGVDNLPPFFFMKNLKEVIMEKDDAIASKPQPQGGVVCSTESCGQPGVKYCTQGCQFMCQRCYDDHQSIRVTKSHKVIPASDGESLMSPKSPPYPPCHRHSHQVVDLYCLKCQQPMCNTCSNSIHDGHRRCELDQQAEVCKIRLKQISDNTDILIDQVNPLSAGDAFKRIHTVFPQLKFDRI